MLKKIGWIGMVILICLIAVGSSFAYEDTYGVKHRVVDHPYLDVKVWVDKGEGANYHPGDNIKVYFQASRDCYVVIYDIDTRGYVSLLYPIDNGDDPYVEGGRNYRIPDSFDDYDLTIDGPEGTEYIAVVASLEPINYPNFPGANSDDEEIYAYKLDGGDPFDFMQDINNEITTSDYASDVCIFNVEYEHPQWYYHPEVVYVDRPVDLTCGGIYFDYPWGVEVWIDGVFYGMTPILIPSLVVGRHYCSFWFNGCWIWRDWCHVRHDYNVRVRANCWDRYRYVEKRYVEKSYRSEKAERRRGSKEIGGLVRPIRSFDGDRIVRRNGSSTERNRQIINDQPVRQRGTEDRLKPTATSVDNKTTKTVRQTESVGIRRTPKSIRSTSTIDRGKAERDTQVERKEIKNTVRERESVQPSEKAKKPEQVKSSEKPKAQPKAERVKTGEQGTKRTNDGSVRKESARSGNTSSGGTSSGDKSQGRRR
jgi:hypothetical protein